MAFLSPLLLLGAMLIVIPIALHLRRRRDPVRVEFPALRLLKRNRHRTETQLRVRRWVLLALRCVLLAMLALALARPLLKPPSADGGPADSDGPAGEGIALALVLDNGPNAAYQSRNRSRLDEAQRLAGKLLDKLPTETPLVLADRSPAGGASNVEPRAALLRVERLAIATDAKPLAAVVRDAVGRLAETPAARREAYVFTDLSAGAWDNAARQVVTSILDQHPGITLRLVDIGVTAPRNVALEELVLPGESLAVGEPLTLTASLHLVGEWTEPLSVMVYVDGDDGPTLRDQRSITPTDNAAIDFMLAGLPEGFTTGHIRVMAGDAAPEDDVRHFAVEVRRPRSVLIVTPREEDAVFFRYAIDPAETEPGAARRFETAVATYDRWARQSLEGYDAVVLLDPPDTIQRGRGWRRLYEVAAGGGGVGLFLGRGAEPDTFNSPDAQALLPVELVRWSRDETYLRPTSFAHPAIQPLAPYANDILWPAFPVFVRWEINEPRDGATVVARYADGAPAIAEQPVGRGRVLVMTTSVSDRGDAPDAWNLLPTGENPWPFVALANSLTDYLTGAAKTRLNYTAGEAVTAPLPTGTEVPGYVLRTPNGEAVRQTIPPGRGELSIASAGKPGAYRIQAGAALDRRFVVNLDPSAGHLERVPFSELAEALGRDRVTLVRDADQLARSIDLGRVGRELYGWVLAIAAVALLGEQWVSSRYYRQASNDQPGGRVS